MLLVLNGVAFGTSKGANKALLDRAEGRGKRKENGDTHWPQPSILQQREKKFLEDDVRVQRNTKNTLDRMISLKIADEPVFRARPEGTSAVGNLLVLVQ